MCNFCNKIYHSKEEYSSSFEYDWDKTDAIIMLEDQPWIYSPCEDWYYSKYVVEANFCPVCGKKIKE